MPRESTAGAGDGFGGGSSTGPRVGADGGRAVEVSANRRQTRLRCGESTEAQAGGQNGRSNGRTGGGPDAQIIGALVSHGTLKRPQQSSTSMLISQVTESRKRPRCQEPDG